MGLPFEPESILDMGARFERALEHVWDVNLIGVDRPGLHREHVFDFKDGIRFIVSQDCGWSIPPFIHLSVSTQDGASLPDTTVVRYWYMIASRDTDWTLALIDITEANVRHYICKRRQHGS